MAADQAPPGAITNPVQVVGKVLLVGVIKGQPFTAESFASKESAASLAAAVRSGMPAVGVSLSDYEAISGLLYPGSVVDVLFSFKGSQEGGETISTTLLKGVQVLAVEDRTIVSSGQETVAPTPLVSGLRSAWSR